MKEKVIIAGCRFPGVLEEDLEKSLEELTALVHTVRGEVQERFIQARQKPDPATFIGKGKIEEINHAVEEEEADLIVFNDELSPGQIRNLDREIPVRVIDRTQLILDIFAGRAHTKEGKIQVELAQLSYLLPRLAGQGESFSRLGGGIGTRGPGETKLETDRRYLLKRMDDLKARLQEVKEQRENYRKQRRRNKAVQFALVGYTNAGKSTLLSSLSGAETFKENLLFATLDPLTRQTQLPSGYPVLLTDTVGFIRNLPTTLIAAFRSTLEEVKEADVLIHVVDASDPSADSHIDTVDKLLEELDAHTIPVITVFNKADQMNETYVTTGSKQPFIYMSARDETDVESLRHLMEQTLQKQMQYYKAKVPVEEGKAIADIQRLTMVNTEKMSDDNRFMIFTGFALVDHPVQGTLQQWKK
ncbi:GTPase HflX [Salibacterium lacus]|uniref:GTPase HflX n=1 Tax=Salibacterium lacus TaxID=1898109 RepID=A0ABW5SY96_9BACI